MRHIHPALAAVARVYGVKPDGRVHGTAQARSHGSQCDQSSHGTPSSPPTSSERNPLQSMKKSPEILTPDSSPSSAPRPLSPSRRPALAFPSTRLTPRDSAKRRRNAA